MIKFGKIIIGLVLLVSLALALSYCGSKSSDSGTTSTGTASAGAGASASSGAIRSATMGLSATAGSSSAPSLSKAKNLSEAINGLYSGLRAKRAEASALKAKFVAATAPYMATSMTQSCTGMGGGTMSMNISTSGTTTTTTITYANCYTTAGTVSEVQNGTIAFVDSGLSFSLSMGNSTTPYTMKSTVSSTGAVLQDDVITMTFTGTADSTSGKSCGTPQSIEYEIFTINMDGNMQLKGIDDTGVAYDETDVATAYTLVANSNLNSACTATGGTITESGKLSYTDNLNSLGTESMDISATNPLSLTWASVTIGTTGDSYNISGSASMVTTCFTGSLTLTTTTDIFYPTSADCPTAGVVTVSGDVNGTVVYTSTGGVQIKDSAGTVVETYTSCNEAQACI